MTTLREFASKNAQKCAGLPAAVCTGCTKETGIGLAWVFDRLDGSLDCAVRRFCIFPSSATILLKEETAS